MKSLSEVALCLVALCVAAPAHAEVGTVLGGNQNFAFVPYAPTYCPGCTSAYSHTDTYNRGTSTLSLYAMADHGVVKASAAASWLGLGVRAAGSAEAKVFDNFTIDAAGLTGREGVFTAQVSMSFTSSYVANAAAAAGMGFLTHVTVNGTESYGLQAGHNETGPMLSVWHNGNLVSPDAPMILTVPFVFGVPMALQMYMNAFVETSTGPGPAAGSFSIVMDAAHSTYWEGLRSVTDRTGGVVTGYTLTSDSGTDWTRNFNPAAVPEPGTGMLLFAGLGMFGLLRQQRRSRCAASFTRPAMTPVSGHDMSNDDR